jgi:hypothetical protein
MEIFYGNPIYIVKDQRTEECNEFNTSIYILTLGSSTCLQLLFRNLRKQP